MTRRHPYVAYILFVVLSLLVVALFHLHAHAGEPGNQSRETQRLIPDSVTFHGEHCPSALCGLGQVLRSAPDRSGDLANDLVRTGTSRVADRKGWCSARRDLEDSEDARQRGLRSIALGR